MERECLRVHGVRGEARPQVFCSMCLMSFPVNATAIAPITATRKWANLCATNTSLLQDLAGAVVGIHLAALWPFTFISSLVSHVSDYGYLDVVQRASRRDKSRTSVIRGISVAATNQNLYM
jgi:hypothetical protein